MSAHKEVVIPDADRRAMSFGPALLALKSGRCVARKEWQGTGKWLALSPGQEVDLPYQLRCRPISDPNYGKEERLLFFTAKHVSHIYVRTSIGVYEPWSPSHSDLLAEDWHAVCVYKEAG